MSSDWLPRTRRALSPNCDARPADASIELVVIHNISLPPGRFGTGLVEALFLNRIDAELSARIEATDKPSDLHDLRADLQGLEVSSHLFIDRRGRATQFVPFSQRAWHAGVSAWRGRQRCNDFAVGIELEGTDNRPYTRAQYRRLARTLDWLFARYPALAVDSIVGHSEIAPARKTDPGPAFDWGQVLQFASRRQARDN
ncbi:MAG: 1,6-anhydro-N-acetylmuramyl-L-alanine amidase AmpD [Pseudomonadota bacterium]